MLAALRSFFTPKPPEAARDTYIALVAQARNPFFYTTLGVPDTLDGRFEMIVLHLFLLEHRLVAGEESRVESRESGESNHTPNTSVRSLPWRAASDSEARGSGSGGGTPPAAPAAAKAFGQFLSEVFFSDMDRSLREIGVSDTGVSHRIKKMGKAYHGRLQAYAAGLQSREAMRGALARNLYGTVTEGDVALLDAMATYVEQMRSYLEQCPTDTIQAGQFCWPAPAGA